MVGTSSPLPPWLEALARRRQGVAYFLLGISGLLALLTAWLIYKYRWENAAVSLWTGLLALLTFSSGLWYSSRERTDLSDADATRLLVLSLGGFAGLLTALLIGLALPFFEWSDTIQGGLEAWRKEWGKVAICLAALFGGLALMFISLQLARGDEQSNPLLRRLLYGYNAILTSLLLLAILVILNVLSYVQARPFKALGVSTDWTASNIHTLSPASVNLLTNLDKPVKVYVLLSTRDPLYAEVQNLMNNCLEVTNKLEVEYVSPDNPRALQRLQQEYQIVEAVGMLVTYGTTPNQQHEFISYEDLGPPDFRTKRFAFKGEDALIRKLTYLTEGKSKAIIYFTQGHGELDLNDTDTARADRGLGVLKERLLKGNYDVRELRLGPAAERVPDDAAVVIVARPTLTMPPPVIGALRQYLKPAGENAKKGRLIALFDVVVGPDGNMVHTGLEDLVAEHGVQVGNDRVMVIPSQNPLRSSDPEIVPAVVNPSSRNPIGEAFQQLAFPFIDVRTVRAGSPPPGGPPSGDMAEALLFVLPSYSWVETNLKPNPTDLIQSYARDPERRKELMAKLSREPLSIAVTVTERATDPHAGMGMMPPTKPRPVMAVFGDATWVSNRQMREGRTTLSYELFASTLNWLRERPAIGQMADPKERSNFQFNAPPEVISRLEWLPALLMLVGVLVLGGGIWVVRRR